MENLFKIDKCLVVILLWLLVFHVNYAQTSLVVHRVQGEPLLQINDSTKSVTKGSLLDKNTVLTMNRDDIIHFVNDEGDIFKLFSTGSFSYEDLLGIPASQNNTSFIKSGFRYFWKELTNTIAIRNKKSGVVYRGEELIAKLNPVDSAFIAGSEIRFEWEPKENKEKDYYFILRDVATNSTIIIGTPATSLTLMVNDNLLKFGNKYEWTIAETKLPPKDFPFSNFEVMSKDQIENSKQKIKQIYSFLSKNGYSREEIRKISCQDFKICY